MLQFTLWSCLWDQAEVEIFETTSLMFFPDFSCFAHILTVFSGKRPLDKSLPQESVPKSVDRDSD